MGWGEAQTPNTSGLTAHPSRSAASMPMVTGTCPACGLSGTLFLAVGGHVTCSSLSCPDPCRVADSLLGRLGGE